MMKRAELGALRRGGAATGPTARAQRLGDARVLRVLLMCRLLAHVSRRPLTVAEAIGAADLASFADLSPRHPDGWGMAWWPTLDAAAGSAPRPSARARSASAREDPAFHADDLAASRACAHVVHLRGATPGLTIELENCHPFVRDRRGLRAERRAPPAAPPARAAAAATSRPRSRARPTASACSSTCTTSSSRAAGRSRRSCATRSPRCWSASRRRC